MFGTSSSRNSGERPSQSNSDVSDLFINNIPIELDRNGLANIFSRAGPIELVKIMPPKNSSNDYTYGFVRFKHKTAAATAIEMFNNYKIGPRCLEVKFSSRSSSSSTSHSYSQPAQQQQQQQVLTKTGSDDGWESISRSTKSVNLINDDECRYTDSGLRRSGQNTSSRHLSNQRESNVRPERGNYDLSRPYAQLFVKRNKIKVEQAQNEAPMEKMKPNEKLNVPSSNVNKNPTRLNEECKASTSEKLEIGKTYRVNLTHVDSPSNFHIQLLSSVSKTGNLMNNLDNYYRNEFADEDENKQYYFETNELCVCYYDSYWYRAQVVKKVPEKRTYLLKIIDFGDIQELPFEYVKKLNKEFCNTERASIRCKLAGISPLKGERNWDPQATQTLLSLAENPSEVILCAEIISCQEVRNKNDQLETIYSVDLLFEGDESIITFFIENEFAIKVNEETHPKATKTQSQGANADSTQHGQRQTTPTKTSSTSTKRYSIFDQQKIDLNLKPNQVCQQVSVTHVESINEFYAQSVENLREIVKLQSKLTNIFKKYEKTYLETYKQVSLHSGDYVFARYQDKKQIDRAIVVKKLDASDMYQLHFVDQAYKDETTSQYIYSASLMHELIMNMGQASDLDDLRAIIELPFQIICCQLKDKKESVRNAEILKALINECLNFQLEIVDIAKQTLGDDGNGRKVHINKYVIRLYSDEDLLDEKFEPAVKQVGEKTSIQTVKTEQVQHVQSPQQSKPITQPQAVEVESHQKNENVLDLDQVYKCKFAFLGDETEMFINLASDVDKMIELEALLNDKIEIEKIQKNTRGKLAFKTGDLVLAKYYLDDEFNWYRAVVNKVRSEREYEVYYIDYGNSDKVVINDLIELPNKYDLNHFKPFAYHVKFNQVNFNANLHLSKLEEYLQSEFLNIKVIKVENEQQSQEHKRDKHIYSVEFWSEDLKVCLNSLIDSSYVPKPKHMAQPTKKAVEQAQPSQKPIVSKPRLIEQTSLTFLGKEMTVNTSSTYIEKLTKPFYLCLEQDISTRKALQESMNQFYAKNSNTCTNLSLKLNDYCAVFSEDNWFRAQVKQTDKNELLLFYIDFGYEEMLDSKSDRIKPLDEQFLYFPRYSFGVVLLNPKDYHTPLELNEDEDENILSDAFERFFAMNTDELVIKIKSKLDLNNNDASPSQVLTNETYYAVQMHNKLDECLNEILFKEKEAYLKKKYAKKQRPDLIRLTSKDLPEQTTDKQIDEKDEYMLFTRRIDLFYIFNENKVKSIQNQIQDICHGILEDQKEFDEEQMRKYDAEHLPNKDDLVFGKYVDDQAWYRCVVTNCNHALGKYELFFVDFGNTEVVAREEILYAWNEEQIGVFKNYEPHAYKCKLFGIVSKPSNDAQKEDVAFKTYTSDNIFNVKFINYNQQEKLFEVSLKCVTNGQTAHEYLLENNLIEMNKFTDILRSINSIEQQDFYIQLLKSLKITRKHFK